MATPRFSPLKLVDLAPRVRAALIEAAPVSADKLEAWIHQPIPVLRGRSVVEVITDQGAAGELEVVALCRRIKGGFP
jgi:hypothetical protein